MKMMRLITYKRNVAKNLKIPPLDLSMQRENSCKTPEVSSPMTPTMDGFFKNDNRFPPPTPMKTPPKCVSRQKRNFPVYPSSTPLMFDENSSNSNRSIVQPPPNQNNPPNFPQMMSPSRNRGPPPPTPFGKGGTKRCNRNANVNKSNSMFILDSSGDDLDDFDLSRISPSKDDNHLILDEDDSFNLDSNIMNDDDDEDDNSNFHPNPFSPDKRMNISQQSHNSTRSSGSGGFYGTRDSSRYYSSNRGKGVAQKNYYSRYNEEFKEVQILGSGSFGKVVKCLHRYDGIHYAIKISTRVIRGERHCSSMLREVQALAALGDNPYIVRYFGSWIEDGRVFVQTEFCDGGSLSDKFDANYRFTERELLNLLFQAGSGLLLMHSENLVHLDIKPENIFIAGDSYKIGDLGFVASSLEFNRDVLEGDCRYLSREILDPTLQQIDLKKVDIFALGATCLELAAGKKLPQNGPQWNKLRDGKIPELSGFSSGFMNLIRCMMDNNPSNRPTADQVVQHRLVRSNKPSYESIYRRNIRLERMLIKLSKVEESLRREIEFLRKESDGKMTGGYGNSVGSGIDIFSSSV